MIFGINQKGIANEQDAYSRGVYIHSHHHQKTLKLVCLQFQNPRSQSTWSLQFVALFFFIYIFCLKRSVREVLSHTRSMAPLLLDSFLFFGALQLETADPSGGIATPLYPAMFMFGHFLSTQGHRQKPPMFILHQVVVQKNAKKFMHSLLIPLVGTCRKGVAYLRNIPYPHIDEVLYQENWSLYQATPQVVVQSAQSDHSLKLHLSMLSRGDADVSFYSDLSPRFQSYRTQRKRDLKK